MARMFPLVMLGLVVLASCAPTPPVVADPPEMPTAPLIQDTGKVVPVANVPLGLSKGRTIGYASKGFGLGKVTVEYRIEAVTPGANGRYQLDYTETMTGDTVRHRPSSATLGSESAFDRGKGLAFQFLEPAGQETVHVPAGTFAAMKYTNKGTPKYSTFWVADGVVVKVVQGDVGGNKPGTGSAELAFLR